MGRLIGAVLWFLAMAGGAQAVCPSTSTDCPNPTYNSTVVGSPTGGTNGNMGNGTVNAQNGLFVNGVAVSAGNVSTATVTATGSTTPRTLAVRAADVINIKDYGAVCDGSTDDRAHIIAADTAANSGNVKTVYFPPSATACMISAEISVPSNVTWWAYPGTVKLQSTPGNFSSNLFIQGFNATNFTAYGLTFDGNWTGQTGGTCFTNNNAAVVFTNASFITFDTDTFQGICGFGLQAANNISYFTLRNSLFQNVGYKNSVSGNPNDARDGLLMNGTGGGFVATIDNGSGSPGNILTVASLHMPGQVTVTFMHIGDTIYNYADSGISGAPTILTQTSGTAGSTGTYTISGSAQLVASQQMVSDSSMLNHHNKIIGNTFINIGQAAVAIGHHSYDVVADNVCNLPGQALFGNIGESCVFLEDGEFNSVTGNTSLYSSGFAYEISGERGDTITGNTAAFAGGGGFGYHTGQIYGARYNTGGYTITGNTFINNGQTPGNPWASGMAFFNAATNGLINGMTISGNVISDTQASNGGTATQLYGIINYDQTNGSGTSTYANFTNLIISSDNSILGNINGQFGYASALSAVPTSLLNFTLPVGNSLTGVTQYAHGSIYTTTADQIVATTTPTSCFGTGVGTQSIPQGAVVAGVKFRVRCQGVYTTPGATPGTLTMTLKWGSTSVVAAGSGTLPVSQTNQAIDYKADCTIRSATTIDCSGSFTYGDSAALSQVIMISFQNLTPVSITTNAAETLDVTTTWSTVAGSQTATFQQGSIEVLN
jgi:hypothetical protein